MRRVAPALLILIPALVWAKGRESLPASDRTIAGIDLTLVSLTDVQAKLGSAEVYTVEGDARICYASPSVSDQTLLAFRQSNGEISFEVIAGGLPFEEREKCATSPLVGHLLATGSGLHVGSLREDVARRFSGATSDGDTLAWESCVERRKSAAEIARWPIGADKTYRDCSSWQAELAGDILLRFRLTHSLTAE